MKRMTWMMAIGMAMGATVMTVRADDAPAAGGIAVAETTTTDAPTAETFQLAEPAKVIAAYGQYVAKQPDVTDAQKQAVSKRVELALSDADQRDGAIVDSLSVIYPDFAKAMDKLANEDDAAAIALLTKLMASSDPYLAANARFFAARLLVAQENFEQALPMTQMLVTSELDKTLYAGQALFLRGVCQAGLLQRKEAMASLRQFIKADADAPERLVVGALHKLDELQQLSDGTLDDVEQRMDYSRRKLALEDSGKPTQQQQQKAVTILEELIKKAEEKEKQGQGGGGNGSGSGQGNAGGPAGGPSGGAQQSTAPVGPAQIGPLHRATHGDKNEQWGAARQHQRDEVLNAIKAKYPERYRELVEQYYRALQEGENK